MKSRSTSNVELEQASEGGRALHGSALRHILRLLSCRPLIGGAGGVRRLAGALVNVKIRHATWKRLGPRRLRATQAFESDCSSAGQINIHAVRARRFVAADRLMFEDDVMQHVFH